MGEPASNGNVRQAVPFFGVTNMERSLRFYVDGLGFVMRHKWIVDDKIRWCWLQRGGAALMLQEIRAEDGRSRAPDGKRGVGVSIVFMCDDALALYREFTGRGVDASRPFVGNNMWVTSLQDPDGYRLDFESETDVPEETVFDESTHT